MVRFEPLRVKKCSFNVYILVLIERFKCNEKLMMLLAFVEYMITYNID